MLKKIILSITRFFIGWFNNIKLRNKLLICNGSLIVLSVVLGGAFSYHNIQKFISEQASELFGQTLEQVKVNIENKLNIYDEIANQILSDNNLSFTLFREHDTQSYAYEYLNSIKPVLDRKNRDNNIFDIFIYKNNETMPDNGSNFVDMEAVKNSWWFKKYFSGYESYDVNDFRRLNTSKIWIVTGTSFHPTDNLTSNKAPVKKVAIIKPIICNYEKLVGVLELDISYDAIFGEYTVEDSSLYDSLCVIDQTDTIIFNNSQSELDDAFLNNESFNIINQKEDGRFNIRQGKNQRLVFYSRGTDSSWTYVKGISVKQLLSSAKSVRDYTIYNGLIGIIISFIIGALIANILSTRIAALVSKMEEVDDLNLDIKMIIDGRDEIGNLAQSYNRMIKKIGQLVDELKVSQHIQKEAEVKALQAQINPHFLYNTLATINWMAIGNDNKKIIAMVNNLSTFYNLSLNKGEEYLTIEDEILLTQAYTDIQKVRWEDRINIFYNVSEDIRKYYTLKLVLQPFVENSINHGAEHKLNGITNIIIKGYKVEDRIILEVTDDGMGMKETPKSGEYTQSKGYGIRNVHEKIAIRFGNQYGVSIFSRAGVGTQVKIILPAIDRIH